MINRFLRLKHWLRPQIYLNNISQSQGSIFSFWLVEMTQNDTCIARTNHKTVDLLLIGLIQKPIKRQCKLTFDWLKLNIAAKVNVELCIFRGMIAYFSISGLDVLNVLNELSSEDKDNIIRWLYSLQVVDNEGDLIFFVKYEQFIFLFELHRTNKWISKFNHVQYRRKSRSKRKVQMEPYSRNLLCTYIVISPRWWFRKS